VCSLSIYKCSLAIILVARCPPFGFRTLDFFVSGEMAAGTCSNMGLQYLDPKDRSYYSMRGGVFRSACTADCALRVEAMLSTAILHQEDIICNLLLLISPESGTDQNLR
jgi:hypothetical protein